MVDPFEIRIVSKHNYKSHSFEKLRLDTISDQELFSTDSSTSN
jgi:hypothetical protein